jgi:hypothetical protein
MADCRWAHAGQARNGELLRRGAEQAVFFALHAATGGGLEIIVAAEMEEAVNDVADEFALPGGVELAGLLHGVVQTEEEFAVQRIAAADVRRL